MPIEPAEKDPCGRYRANTTTPTNVQMIRYDPMNSNTASRRAPANLDTAGAAPGSIIAAIIGTHRAMKKLNDPTGVATPMSIPFISWTATTHDRAASPNVAVRAVALAAVLVLIAGYFHHVQPSSCRCRP